MRDEAAASSNKRLCVSHKVEKVASTNDTKLSAAVKPEPVEIVDLCSSSDDENVANGPSIALHAFVTPKPLQTKPETPTSFTKTLPQLRFESFKKLTAEERRARQAENSDPIMEVIRSLDKDDLELDDLKDADAGKLSPDELKQILSHMQVTAAAASEAATAAASTNDSFVRGLNVPLLRHQVVGVAWMTRAEDSAHHGGILADDMGLGKTIQTIAMMLKHQPAKDALRKTTLIVAPVALLDQWYTELTTKSKAFRVLKFYGKDKCTLAALPLYDVVLTSYRTLTNDFPKPDAEGNFPPVGPLIRNRWHRVVLDEAHEIRNRRTQLSKACAALDSKYRWCLTGTPLHNSVDDFYSLFRFLRMRMFKDYGIFRQRITKELKTGGLQRLQVILNTCLVRRLKTMQVNGEPLIVLPERNVLLEKHEFTPQERDFYQAMETHAKAQFSVYVQEGTGK